MRKFILNFVVFSMLTFSLSGCVLLLAGGAGAGAGYLAGKEAAEDE